MVGLQGQRCKVIIARMKMVFLGLLVVILEFYKVFYGIGGIFWSHRPEGRIGLLSNGLKLGFELKVYMGLYAGGLIEASVNF